MKMEQALRLSGLHLHFGPHCPIFYYNYFEFVTTLNRFTYRVRTPLRFLSVSKGILSTFGLGVSN